MNSTSQLDIANGLRRFGVAPGNVLLVHSSLKSFGRVEGGADTVIDALLEAVAPGGTILVPTLTGTREDSPSNPPVFDVRQSPCWTGRIPETFRCRPEACRSLHPTHSVAAIGPHADFLIRDHLTCATPCGTGSPYLRLAELDGRVIFLGVTLACCTLLHGVEETAGCDYVLQPEPVRARVTDQRGSTGQQLVRIHSWATARDFERLEPIFRRDGILRKGRIGRAEVRVLNARLAVERALALLKECPTFLCRTQPQPA